MLLFRKRVRGICMKKYFFVLLSMLIAISIAGCSETFDEEGFGQVQKYTNEIIPEVDKAIHNSDSWLNNKTDENLSMMVESANRINEINNDLWKFSTNDEYNREEIESWTIKLTSQNDEWIVEGKDLYPLLTATEDDSDYLAHVILKIEKEASESNIEELGNVMNDAKNSIKKLRKIMTNK